MSPEQFVDELATHKLAGTFNPWRECCPQEISDSGFEARKERLVTHFENSQAQYVLVGEAPGYQGCRYSGVAFTSERLLLEGAIPFMPDLGQMRISRRKRPFSEPSATIVWGALHEHGIADKTLLHNAFPYHPEGSKGIHSNRTPTELERKFGLELLSLFFNVFSGMKVAALGNTASKSLSELGIKHIKLRHPANGGATKFRNGLRDFIQPKY